MTQLFDVPTTLFIIFLVSIGGSIIQGSTGFGYGIFVMIFFPLLLAYLPAVGLSSLISFGGLCIITWKYKKHIRWKLLPQPLIVYYIVSTVCIVLSTKIDTSWLKSYLGLFLVVLALYFAFFSGKIKVKPNLPTAAVVGTLSGILSGFFAIGGPPMVIYFLAATDSKEEYLGTCQCFFLLTAMYTTVLRVLNGIITADLVPFVLVGYAGYGVGIIVAGAIVKKINSEMLKKIIYAVIGISGLWLFVSNI